LFTYQKKRKENNIQQNVIYAHKTTNFFQVKSKRKNRVKRSKVLQPFAYLLKLEKIKLLFHVIKIIIINIFVAKKQKKKIKKTCTIGFK